MPLIWIDVVIVMIVGISCLFGLWRGFVREVLSLLAWVAAILIARVYAQPLSPLFASWVESVTMQYVLAFALLFIAVLVVGALLNRLFARLVNVTGLLLTDRLLGAAFGVARGIVIVMLLVFFGSNFFATESWWQSSRFIPQAQEWIEMSRVFVTEGAAPQDYSEVP